MDAPSFWPGSPAAATHTHTTLRLYAYNVMQPIPNYGYPPSPSSPSANYHPQNHDTHQFSQYCRQFRYTAAAAAAAAAAVKPRITQDDQDPKVVSTVTEGSPNALAEISASRDKAHTTHVNVELRSYSLPDQQRRMDTITIPSPTAFLADSPVSSKVSIAPAPASAPPSLQPAPTAPAKTPISRNPSTTTTGLGTASSGVSKPKQSKSRNGCITCKAKRLKCDETKPECQQCFKRKVTCGGYKKDFKWRSFEETTFVHKPASKNRKAPSPPPPPPPRQPQKAAPPATCSSPSETASWESKTEAKRSSSPSPSTLQPPSQQHLEDDAAQQFSTSMDDGGLTMGFDPHMPPFFLQNALQDLDSHFHITGLTPEAQMPDMSDLDAMHHSYTAASSPRLIDLLLPGTDMNRPPPPNEQRPPDSPAGSYQPRSWHSSGEGIQMDEDIEEIIRSAGPGIEDPLDLLNSHADHPVWFMQGGSPALSNASSESDVRPILRSLRSSTSELIAVRFNEDTCGILSVKNGNMENPWRTMIWPLAQESEALNSAISSLTSFHISKGIDESGRMDNFGRKGLKHMVESIRHLNMGLNDTRTDISLATTLVLAFAESWDRGDRPIATGIQHLRGAKSLVKHALGSHRAQGSDLNKTPLLRFLINTWVYMDVIARLTSVSNDDNSDLQDIVLGVNNPLEINEVDPLLGCAATLFPIIGNVGSLIGMVRQAPSNDLNIISRASELKSLLEQWEAPDPFLFESPEDRDSNVQHSLQTAEAYRHATLLYLYEAVPEIPSKPSEELAKNVLRYLATIPTTSRATITHIYPLLAASCNVTLDGDRKFCIDRWSAVTSRLRIGNADKCVAVVEEVWRRRDAYEGEKLERFRIREQNRLSTTFPRGYMGNTGEKRKASADDLLDVDSLFTFGMDSSFDEPAYAQPGTKRRAVDGERSEPMPIPRRMPSLPQNPTVAGRAPPSFAQDAGRKRSTGRSEASMDFEYTVRGRLHWVGVMADWNCEILLG